MSINLRPLNKDDVNYSKVIDLYREAFTGAHHFPAWLLRFKLRKGKAGFSILYDDEAWIGLIYATEHNDIVFVHFFAIPDSLRSGGYGSKVIQSIRGVHHGKRIVLNIEELDEQAEDLQKRVRRKAFYASNGFDSSGYMVTEPAERLEMLILGGTISKEEIESIYKSFLGSILGFIMRPQVVRKSELQ